MSIQSRNSTIPPLIPLAVILLLVLACFLSPAAAIGAQEAPQAEAAELAGRHRQWLTEDVSYIISEVEREAFLLLESDAQRDAFIEAFWRIRDPTPGTVRNEAREEHERRIKYANRYLGSETPRRGWQTDRGRIYIQLGEPAERQTYPDPRSFWPIELWFYRSEPGATGLPPFFYVMFFRPMQGGEFKMYDPITDGPGALAKDFMLQMADAREIVGRLLTGVGHEVALASVNLIPSEPTDLTRPRPSARNNFLFGAIEKAPTKGIDDRYAREFVAARGNVEASVVFDQLPIQLSALAFWDSRGLPYLHYGVEIPRERALIGEYQGNYLLSLQLGYDIDDARGQQIVLDGNTIEEYFDEERARQVMASPVAYYDRVGLVPGVYELTVTLANRLTEDDSATSTRVSIANASSGNPLLSDILVASAVSPAAALMPGDEPPAFQFGGEQFLPAAGGRLARDGVAEIFLQMVAMPDLPAGVTVEPMAMLVDAEGNEIASASGSTVAVAAPPEPTPLRLSLPLGGASAGPYTVRIVAVLSTGQSLSREAPVELVNPVSFKRPEVFLAKEKKLEGTEEYRLRGWQHLRKGELRAAEAYLAVAVEAEPDNAGLRRSLAGIRIRLGEYAAALEVIEPATRLSTTSDIDLLVYSEALRGSGAPAQAAAVARDLLQRRPTAPAYNALAEALIDLGNTSEAIAAYEASLALIPEQPAVREALARLREGGGAADSTHTGH